MEITIMRPVKVEVAILRLSVAVRHIANDFPFRTGDIWQIDIDVDEGQIINWPGPAFIMCMKVVDQGSYYLIDPEGNEVAQIEGDYAPSDCGIGGGDYIEMRWDEDGFIAGWGNPDFGDFMKFIN